MKRILIGAALAATLLAPAYALSHKMPPSVQAAVDDSRRPDADKQLDAERKPAEMLVVAKIKPGAKVMDLIPGGGYFTRLFAVAVGPKGYVYAFQPSEFSALRKDKTKPPAIRGVAAQYDNVSVIDAPVNTLTAPEPLDVVWTSQNYHD